MRISIPPQINGNGLFPFLASLDVALQEEEPVTLDFSGLRRVTPPGLVALVATVVRWRREHHPVVFYGIPSCPIAGYLKRMDVLQTCGIEVEENFRRHEARGRFLPVRIIDHRVDEMGADMALCLAPGGDDYGNAMSSVYDLSWYVLTETAMNVRQHSRGLGYVCAQVNRNEGLVRLAMADNGRGILQSFQDAGLVWSENISDAEAIVRALEPRISSGGGPVNAGVGLTLVSGLVRAIGGWMLIVSGTGALYISKGRIPQLLNLVEGAKYQGTLLTVGFRQQALSDFSVLLERVKLDSERLQSGSASAKFRS